MRAGRTASTGTGAVRRPRDAGRHGRGHAGVGLRMPVTMAAAAPAFEGTRQSIS